MMCSDRSTQLRLQSKPIDPKNINRIHKRTVVVNIARQIHSIPRNHVRRAHCIEIVEANIVAEPIAFNTEDPRLTHRARAYGRTRRAVVVKERVQPDSVTEDVVTSHNAETPSARSAGSANTCAVGEGSKDGVVEGRVWWEGDGGVRIGLVVGCFGLNLAHEDVAGVDELVLVENMVFDCCAPSEHVSFGR